MASNISANEALSSYALLNATDIKSFIINQLSNSENSIFSGCSYLGSNMNALIDVISVMTQQLLFHFSVNTSESSFATANLFENMSKLVNILNYKIIGKQTSMLPVRFTINVDNYKKSNDEGSSDIIQITIPRFTKVFYNSSFYLKNEIIIPIEATTSGTLTIDTVMFEGELKESSLYEAVGDEFETFILKDNYINQSNKFISDNFFVVYVQDFDENGNINVDENGNPKWVEYTETSSLFLNGANDKVFERRFTEDMNYEFKFGNGTHGVKLPNGVKIQVYYILSSGEEGILGDGTVSKTNPLVYSSPFWDMITKNISYNELNYMTVSNTGNGTNVSYPESVESIRTNAPKVFSSLNRLFTTNDYKTFILKNYSSYVKDIYVCTNEEFTKSYLKYYYELGLDSPQEDSRLNIAQVQFMTSTNFNNIYGFVVPKVNTIISGKVPNYVNTTLKQEIVNGVASYKGLTHNPVLIDPIYKAITFGSYMDDSDWNANQLENKLVLVRNRLTKYSHSFIKEKAIEIIKQYFDGLSLGSEIDLGYLSKEINNISGVERVYVRNNDGGVEKKITLFVWNPLYSNEDNYITQQNIVSEPFVYHYFYDIDNIEKLILVEDEQ